MWLGGTHFTQFRLSVGRCRDPWQRKAKRSSSPISEQRDCCIIEFIKLLPIIFLKIEFMIGTFSCWALRFEFQQNSKIATTMAMASPQSSTTNTPPVINKIHFSSAWTKEKFWLQLPIFWTPKALAFDSLFCCSRLQTSPVSFHHLLYSRWMTPFSCSSRMASEMRSRQGEPTQTKQWI